jgi:hypothetical protein
MYKLKSALLITVFFIAFMSCKKDKIHTPPSDAEIISFTQNTNLKNRVIYQAESLHTFNPGESLHRYWVGINKKPSHRLHARLLSDSKDILFTIFYPGQNKKVYSKPMDSKDFIGCEIPEQSLTEDEFIIEVFAPKGVVNKKNPVYRLFVGIRGIAPLEFYSKNENTGKK